MMLRVNESGKVSTSPAAFVTSAASDESKLDFVFGWTGSNARFPCERFFPQAGELTADSSGCGAVEHETQKQMSRNCADTLRQK